MPDDFDSKVADRFKVRDDVPVPDTWSRVQFKVLDHAEPPPPLWLSRNGHSRRPVEGLAPIVVERRIRSARRRPRPRLIIASTVAAAVVAIIAGALVVATRIERIETIVPAAAPTTVDPATALAAGTSELVASMYAHHGVDPGVRAVMWLYLSADGRLVSTTWGRSDWVEQRLTPYGIVLVLEEILASGLFDPDQPPPGSDQPPGPPTWIQVRNDDRLVKVNWVPDREWSSDYRQLVERLRTLEFWLPASAWEDPDATTYVPDRYAICMDRELSDILPRLSAAAAAILDSAPLLEEPTRNIDAAIYEQRLANPLHCLDLTTEQAQSLAESLNAELTVGDKGFEVPIDETIGLTFTPILPHGVIDTADYG
jgi:hypothetical protein